MTARWAKVGTDLGRNPKVMAAATEEPRAPLVFVALLLIHEEHGSSGEIPGAWSADDMIARLGCPAFQMSKTDVGRGLTALMNAGLIEFRPDDLGIRLRGFNDEWRRTCSSCKRPHDGKRKTCDACLEARRSERQRKSSESPAESPKESDGNPRTSGGRDSKIRPRAEQSRGDKSRAEETRQEGASADADTDARVARRLALERVLSVAGWGNTKRQRQIKAETLEGDGVDPEKLSAMWRDCGAADNPSAMFAGRLKNPRDFIPPRSLRSIGLGG